ncbi:kinesin-like protein KIN-14S, partial [Tanacetum coccineum]
MRFSLSHRDIKISSNIAENIGSDIYHRDLELKFFLDDAEDAEEQPLIVGFSLNEPLTYNIKIGRHGRKSQQHLVTDFVVNRPELERQLVAKEASLPQEPTFDDVNAVNPDQKVSKMKEFMSNVCTALRTIEEEHETLKKKYQTLQKRCELECSERRRLHNALIELKGNTRVFCRCRPLNHDEKAGGSTYVVDFESCLENELKIIGAEQFKFDHIFRPEDNQ